MTPILGPRAWDLERKRTSNVLSAKLLELEPSRQRVQMRLVDAASEYTPVSSRRGAKRVAQAFFLVLLGLSISGFRSCWTSSELAAAGNHAVGVHTASVLVDPERNREIPISVWYPSEGEAGAVTPEGPLAQNGPYPLIVSAHGLGDRPQSLAKLHEHMASHGFVIAAPRLRNVPAGIGSSSCCAGAKRIGATPF